MKTLREIKQKADEFGRENPHATISDAYRQAYIDFLREDNPQILTSEPRWDGPEGDTSCPSFEDFWNAYGKKRGRKKCKPKWDRLSPSQKMAIMEHVPLYVASTPDVQYRLDPLTYLNGERWEDEIIMPKNSVNNGNPELAYANSQAGLIARLDRERGRGSF